VPKFGLCYSPTQTIAKDDEQGHLDIQGDDTAEESGGRYMNTITTIASSEESSRTDFSLWSVQATDVLRKWRVVRGCKALMGR
jgi:hypothetical protein